MLASDPERELPARVQILNQSNVPATVQVGWDSPEKTLAFEPSEPKQVSLALEESTDVEYKVRPHAALLGGRRERASLYSERAGRGRK